VDKNNIDDIARAIASLNVWGNASKYNWALDSELFDNSSLRVLMEAKKDKSNVPMIKPPDAFRKNEIDKRPKLIKPKKSFFDFFKFG
jgi:hypothetical protein